VWSVLGGIQPVSASGCKLSCSEQADSDAKAPAEDSRGTTNPGAYSVRMIIEFKTRLEKASDVPKCDMLVGRALRCGNNTAFY